MRNIWHQQTLKHLAKEVTFEVSANCTSTPDSRLQVFLSWVQQQFEKLFPSPSTPAITTMPPAAIAAPSAKKLKVDLVQDNPPTIMTQKLPTPNAAIMLSFQSSKTSASMPEDKALKSVRPSSVHSPMPSKEAAPPLIVLSKEVAVPASKLLDISAVPVVKVSGPLLRTCSKAVSTMSSDPDMVWFVSPGGFTFALRHA